MPTSDICERAMTDALRLPCSSTVVIEGFAVASFVLAPTATASAASGD